MKVLLTHGYFIHEDPAERGIMKPYPPVGLLFLSAWLKKWGIDHEVYDTTFGDMQGWKEYLENLKPGIIGLYANLMTKANILEMMAFTKASQHLQNTKIIIGGPDARYNAENYLAAGVDIVVAGEGEEPLREIIRALSTGESADLQGIKGIYFAGQDGHVIHTGDRRPMNIREIPFPNYEYIDVRAYLNTWKNHHGYSSMTINSMRGCPYSCNWCSKSVFGNSHRRRDPGTIAEEMSLIRDTWQPDQIWFTDDVFTISKEWMREFSTEIQKRNLTLPYECIARSDCLDDEMVLLLKQTGCRKVWIGAESGSQKVINLMNRKTDLVRTTVMLKLLKSTGISTGTFIMMGYPGETRADILETGRFLERIMPDDLTIGVAYPIKGTKYYEIIESTFDPPFNWKMENERQVRFKRAYSDRFYRFSARYLRNKLEFKRKGRGPGKWILFLKAMISKTYIEYFH